MATGRLLKGVTPGVAIGVDELGRYLSPTQRGALVAWLSREVEERAAALVADARAAAAAILAEAEADADAIRARAHANGYETGYAAGHAEGHAAAHAEIMGAMQAGAAILRRAADEAEATRSALLAGAEEQAVALALAAARHVVGAAADAHDGLAATLVRDGLRASGGRAVRIRVNPADTDAVASVLVMDGKDIPVQAETAIAIGGCIIDVEGGSVDLRLDTQLAAIHDALLGGN